jgi:toxin YoeB
MGRGIQWDGDAWDECCQWQQADKATLKRINALIKDARRDPFDGIGKPEALKHELSGLWSRRINHEDRLTYYLKDEILVIVSCKGHYE